MCGRFNFSADEVEEIKAIVQEVNQRLYGGGPTLRTGEIFPTNTVPVLIQEQGEINPYPMSWGFPQFSGKGVIINARSETVLDKKMFRSSVLSRRCVIATSGFYEWANRPDGKQKYIFHLPGTKLLHIAGFYNTFTNKDTGNTEERFVILTTEANESMADEEDRPLSFFPDDNPRMIHDRMPLVLRPDECKTWLGDHTDYEKVFDRSEIKLVHEPAA